VIFPKSDRDLKDKTEKESVNMAKLWGYK